jgi:hypothetical protein
VLTGEQFTPAADTFSAGHVHFTNAHYYDSHTTTKHRVTSSANRTIHSTTSFNSTIDIVDDHHDNYAIDTCAYNYVAGARAYYNALSESSHNHYPAIDTHRIVHRAAGRRRNTCGTTASGYLHAALAAHALVD